MSGIIFYSTIVIEADSSGFDVSKFDDFDSIQADSVRIYNAGDSEVFVGFGMSHGVEAIADLNSFPIAPKDSVILYKGIGNDQIAAVTENGKVKIRCTAIETGEGNDAMGVLNMVSVLKDAMGNQKAIDSAVSKLANAKSISDAKKQEAKDAAKVIADAKTAMEILATEKFGHVANVASHAAYVTNKESELSAQQDDIDLQKKSIVDSYKEQCDAIAAMQDKAEQRHISADRREFDVAAREKLVADKENDLENKIKAHEDDKVAFEIDMKKHADEVSALDLRKKKLAEAIG